MVFKGLALLVIAMLLTPSEWKALSRAITGNTTPTQQPLEKEQPASLTAGEGTEGVHHQAPGEEVPISPRQQGEELRASESPFKWAMHGIANMVRRRMRSKAPPPPGAGGKRPRRGPNEGDIENPKTETSLPPKGEVRGES